jgi:hypothetical protein
MPGCYVVRDVNEQTRRRSCTTQGIEAVSADLLARLNDEYPASRHSTAWVLDESGVPTRRAGANIGDEVTQEPAKKR